MSINPMYTRAARFLTIIAQHDPEAARLGRLVLDQRIATGGNVYLWVVQLDTAVQSLHGPHGKTRLAHIASRELTEPLLEITTMYDPSAANLARQVLQQRLATGGDVVQWITQITTAVQSLELVGKTRLAQIAARELEHTYE